jgi:hypothetical protein
MSRTPEALYLQLGSLVAQMPDLAHGPNTPEMNRWLGRAVTVAEMILRGDLADIAMLRTAANNLSGTLRESNAQTITAIIHGALAKAELNAPAALSGIVHRRREHL